jgi:hypothetical protein
LYDILLPNNHADGSAEWRLTTEFQEELHKDSQTPSTHEQLIEFAPARGLRIL